MITVICTVHQVLDDQVNAHFEESLATPVEMSIIIS